MDDIQSALQTVLEVLGALSIVGTVLYSYLSVYTGIGLFTTRVFPPTDRRYRYAIVIAARNEAAVIGQLINSIHKQDYPKELVTVFVVADNCTDGTARIARELGAICYERFDDEHRTKGYALEFLFDQIEKDFGICSFDGYFIFDADNLLKSDYITRMNEAYDTGEKIITGYRNTKNFADNWISASYGIHWLRTVRFEHRARSVLRLATRIQGTGLLVSSDLLRDGWHYTSLTEDRELSADAVVNGYRITFNNAAEFYDEQPTSMRVALRQRIRWAKGHLQIYKKSGWKLFANTFKKRSFMSWDMLLIVFPRSLAVAIRKLLMLIINISLLLLGVAIDGGWRGFLLGTALTIGRYVLRKIPEALYVFISEHKRIGHIPLHKVAFYSLMWCTFDVIGRLALCIAAVSKVEWKPIPHNRAMEIEELSAGK